MKNYKYGIIGQGAWGVKVKTCLLKMGKEAAFVKNTRRRSGEDKKIFQARIEKQISSLTFDTLWLCIPHSDTRDILMIAAIKSNKKLIVEKPWMSNRHVTSTIMKLSKKYKVKISVTLQYLFLEIFNQEKIKSLNKSEYQFEGIFSSQKENLKTESKLNLGFHLLSIHQNFFSNTKIFKIKTSHNTINQRSIKIFSGTEVLFTFDFTANKEPILERFIQHFESDSNNINCDLKFSNKIYKLFSKKKIFMGGN